MFCVCTVKAIVYIACLCFRVEHVVPGYIRFGMIGFGLVGVLFWLESVSVLVAPVMGCVR